MGAKKRGLIIFGRYMKLRLDFVYGGLIMCIAKRKHLEMFLDAVPDFTNPISKWEQYKTPADLAASILWRAKENQHIYNKEIIDIGSGTGILGIGASALGASRILFLDIDRRTHIQRKKWADLTNVPFTTKWDEIVSDLFQSSVIGEKNERVGLMNPPFGVQGLIPEKKFVSAAMMLCSILYVILSETQGIDRIIKEIANKKRLHHTKEALGTIKLQRQFKFHKKESHIVNVQIVRFEKK